MLWRRFRPESVSLDEKAGFGGTLSSWMFKSHGVGIIQRAEADDLCNEAMAVMEPQDVRLGSVGRWK